MRRRDCVLRARRPLHAARQHPLMRSTAWAVRASAVLLGATALCGPALPATTASAVAHDAMGLANGPRLTTSSRGAVPDTGTPWVSNNWSGYAVSGSGITDVGGSWTVPSVQASLTPTYSATWVGIDGFDSATDPYLIQAGTEQDSPGGYSAWFSTSYYEQAIGAPVRPGDAMTAAIHQVSGATWHVTLTDDTEGWVFSEDLAYFGPGRSAEWVTEAPSLGGRPTTLAQYATTTFDLAEVNGGDPLLLPVEAGVMVPAGSALPASMPSLPDLDTDGFSVAYGFTPPLPPAS